MTAARPPFQRILVPVDLSTRSANALGFAVALGSRNKAEIDVLHVWHSDLATAVTVARDRAKSALREFVAALELEGDVVLRRRIDHGDPYLTIQRIAQLAGHDLIVVAGPEANRSSAETVARSLFATAPNAVLFVPPHKKPRFRSEHDRALRLERILVPLSLAGPELEAVSCAEALAEPDGAVIEVLCTADVTAAELSKLGARPASERLEERSEALESVLAVHKRASENPPDLVVFCGKRAQAGARVSDPRAERMALGQPCPSLCLPG